MTEKWLLWLALQLEVRRFEYCFYNWENKEAWKNPQWPEHLTIHQDVYGSKPDDIFSLTSILELISSTNFRVVNCQIQSNIFGVEFSSKSTVHDLPCIDVNLSCS